MALLRKVANNIMQQYRMYLSQLFEDTHLVSLTFAKCELKCNFRALRHCVRQYIHTAVMRCTKVAATYLNSKQVVRMFRVRERKRKSISFVVS